MNTWLDMIVKLYENKLKLGSDIMKGSKRQKVSSYLDVLETARQEVITTKDKELEKLLKSFYHDLYVIKEDSISIQGDNKLTEEQKKKKKRELINDQIYSLDKWLDYFLWSEDANNYSAWEVFWVLEGLQKLGRYDDTKKYLKRDSTTIYPFPDVNEEAVFNSVKLMEEYISNKKGDEAIRAALGQANFKILYEYSLEQLEQKKEKNLSTDGIWQKYSQGSDYKKLFHALQDTKTGWCTAIRESFAKDHLVNGDFYVFYTKDEKEEYTVPRIAIRLNGDSRIMEIKGVAQNQNVETDMLKVLREKLNQFKDVEKYFDMIDDLQMLADISSKSESGIDLNREELKFLYELDKKIEFFGWKPDTIIDEIKSKRNVKKDLSYILDCSEKEIATNIGELDETTIAYSGDLVYEKETINCPKLKYILGEAYLPNIKTSEGLTSLTTIVKDASFLSLRDASGFKNLKIIGGKADFESLISSYGLSNLTYIGGDAVFVSLLSATYLVNLKKIKRSARFHALKDARGFYSLTNIEGNAYFNALEDTKGLESLKEIGYSARFPKAKNADGLKSLISIGDDADFPKLTDAKGFVNLVYIGGDAYFNSLKNPRGLERLISIGDDAEFPLVLSTTSFFSLSRVGGNANFESLIYPKNLKNLNIRGTTTLSKPLVLVNKLVKERRK